MYQKLFFDVLEVSIDESGRENVYQKKRWKFLGMW